MFSNLDVRPKISISRMPAHGKHMKTSSELFLRTGPYGNSYVNFDVQ